MRDFVRAGFSAGNIKGMFLTIPQKSVVMDMRGESSVLARLAGELLDGEGLVHSLSGFNIAYTGKRVLILGAGGGAVAIAASLVSPASQASRGATAEIALYYPTHGRAEALAVRPAAAGPASVHAVPGNDPAGFDVVINASPLGLRLSDAMPSDVSRMSPQAALVGVLMKNQPTPVVRAARARGCRRIRALK